ncbi:hypothetical protein DF122_30405 [Burkholderia pseudomallei]|uniref:Uncharacterized protein n=2 Tax=Burkholderia pseudomallei TaxID=28450 RepID=A0AAX0U6B2_BURPE|nr:hypothetical protein BURPS1106A_A0959 [Burkholderia pseudomallei 1106a]AFR18923.1 hypothetical protein BPC006_II0994 [Burkholderia pseudomallei BPC006]ARK47744.1 hypothetical protein BOC35_10105 [Burkholderia pseudomallei]EEC38051.1 hypothetical protein BUC_5136 [Burkholderia pseudomallei 576]EES23001.1 hypothetical protein BURPS1106B_1028 [Burkholderia pseudomallei 1106b]PNX00715.1 hypothetical protein CF649_21500 [Burkholderia sp. 136(2017)]PNX12780.1 hypothetical protein CF650_23195 [Bu
MGSVHVVLLEWASGSAGATEDLARRVSDKGIRYLDRIKPHGVKRRTQADSAMRRKTDTPRRRPPKQWTSSKKAVYSYSSRCRRSMRESRAVAPAALPRPHRQGGRGRSGAARRATEKSE